jgi:nicotinamide riboside transporter PnuC
MIILSWIALIVNVTAVLLSVHKLKSSWVVGLFSCFLWSIYAIQTNQNALLITQLIFIAINIYGYVKWIMDEFNGTN